MKPTRAIKKSSANYPVKKSLRLVKQRTEKLNRKENLLDLRNLIS